jgi:hypothetical protein
MLPFIPYTLKWEYNSTCGALSFEIKRTLNGLSSLVTWELLKVHMPFLGMTMLVIYSQNLIPIYEVSAIYEMT